jgi:multiple sugar transport system permease protein
MATTVQRPTAPARARRSAPGRAAPGGRAGRAEGTTKRTLYVLAAVLAVIVFVVPLIWAVLRAFQPNSVITAPAGLSALSTLGLGNFRGLTSEGHILRAVGNSLVVAVSTAILTTILATAAGYGLGRFRFRGANVAFALILVTLMIPFQAILTPLFLELNAMNLTNSRLGLVLFYSTVNLPFGVFVMRTAFASVPGALEEAARVDGAGTLRTFTDVLRPLVLPGMATTALYAFLAAWTEFLGALTFLTSENLYTLPVSLVNLQLGAYGQVNYGFLAAGAVIAMVPCVILFVALQRFYVEGMAAGGVKG